MPKMLVPLPVLAGMLACPAQPVAAQHSASSDAPQADVVVIAPRQEKLDTTSYKVEETPALAVMSASDVLKRVPALRVDGNGSVSIFGQAGATVLIDGKRVGDVNAALRALPGATVDRIEVVSNPSARYGSDGRSGVVNILLRERFVRDRSLTGTTAGDRLGTVSAKVNPVVSSTSVSFNGTAAIERQRLQTELQQAIVSAPSSLSDYDERSHTDASYLSFSVAAKAAVLPFKGIKITASYSGAGSSGTGRGRTVTSGESRNRGYADTTTLANHSGFLSIDSKNLLGALSANLTGGFNHALAKGRYTDPTIASSNLEQNDRLSSSGRMSGTFRKIDLETAFEYSSLSSRSQRAATIAASSDANDDLRGHVAGLDGYLTLGATPLPRLSLLIGARSESRSYTFPTGSSVAERDYAEFVPSAHTTFAVSKATRFSASFTHRYSYPSVSDLNPAEYVGQPGSGSVGNPDLRPESTSSWEEKLDTRLGKHSITAVAAERDTSGVFLRTTELQDGILFSRLANLGQKSTVALTLQSQGPLGKNIKYRASATCTASTYSQFGTTSGDLRAVNCVANSGVTFLGHLLSRNTRDQMDLDLSYSGRRREPFTIYHQDLEADLLFTHPMQHDLSVALRMKDIFGSSGYRFTALLANGQGYYSRKVPAQRLEIVLSKKLQRR